MAVQLEETEFVVIVLWRDGVYGLCTDSRSRCGGGEPVYTLRFQLLTLMKRISKDAE